MGQGRTGWKLVASILAVRYCVQHDHHIVLWELVPSRSSRLVSHNGIVVSIWASPPIARAHGQECERPSLTREA